MQGSKSSIRNEVTLLRIERGVSIPPNMCSKWRQLPSNWLAYTLQKRFTQCLYILSKSKKMIKPIFIGFIVKSLFLYFFKNISINLNVKRI